jgi:pimeloyl-ACP methyl ester carboxylesterase
VTRDAAPHSHSEEAGAEGLPLIALVHGAMDRSAGMLKLSRRLDHDYRVLRYDRRGYARSSPHPGPFTIAHQVDDLIALLAGRPAVLVGHSYGGNVALAAAAQHPHLVRGVVTYESPVSWLSWWPSATAGGQAIAGAADPAAAAERFMRRLIGEARWDALPERTRATRRAEGVALVGELSDLRAHAPWLPGAVTVPVWVGVGEAASPHQRQGMEYVAEALPEATLVELPGGNHMANVTHPDLFRRLLIDPLVARVGSW